MSDSINPALIRTVNYPILIFLIHINKLISTIRNNRQERFTQKQVEDITNKIKELNQTGVLNKINHILYVKKRQNANKKSK